MSSGIVVVLLVAAGEANAPSTTTIAAAAMETLGPNASFVVREIAIPTDNDALAAEDQLQAAAVVEIVWSGAARTRVLLRMHLNRLDRWVQREVAFLPVDNPRERSRTVGFALASMLSSESDIRNTLAKAARDGAAESTKTKTTAESEPRPERDAGAEPEPRAEPEAPNAREPRPRSPPGPPPPPPSEPYAIDLTAVGAMGIGGPAGGLGGAVRIEYFVEHTFWLAAGLGVRSGVLRIPNGGDDLVLSALAGGAWRPMFPTSASPIELAVTMQAGVFIHDLSYFPPPGPAAKHNHKVIPGGQLMIEGGVRLDASWEVIASVGAEAVFGTTDVVIMDGPTGVVVGTIPPFRGRAAAGVRFRF